VKEESKPHRSRKGIVYLAGAGPGNLGLVTLRTRELLETADVILYDQLCNPKILRWARPEAECICVGKKSGERVISQREIESLLIQKALAGKKVLRLKGGDPFLFGRGGEEAMALAQADIPFEIVPGVTSALAVPAYAGIPVSHRDLSSAALILTGHEDPEKKDAFIRWDLVALLPATKVILMGAAQLRGLVKTLIENKMNPETPSAAIQWGTYPWQRTVEATLENLPDRVQSAGLGAPLVVVIGEVTRLRGELQWWEKKPLFGQRIVLTRPIQELERTSALLAGLGAEVLEIPTIRIEAIPLAPAALEFLKTFRHRCDWLVFTSANGVRTFFARFFELHRDIRELGETRIAAVGTKTAAILQDLNLNVDVLPASYTTDCLAYTLQQQDLTGKRVCLARGSSANPELARSLREAGAEVFELALYRTLPQESDITGDRARFLEKGADWILFASPSAVHGWHALGLKPPIGCPMPKIASIGPVTSQSLRRLGYPVDCEAKEHTMEGLLVCLQESLKQLLENPEASPRRPS
jgi:uroporphyrinogen III methyltransferase/synthase